MKTTPKIFALISAIAIIMVSCDVGIQPQDQSPTLKPEDLYKLHYIRPTKPIRIPDTMTITTMKPAILQLPPDTTSQDSIPQPTNLPQ